MDTVAIADVKDEVPAIVGQIWPVGRERWRKTARCNCSSTVWTRGLRVTESCHWEVDWLLLASCKRKKTWMLQPTRPVRQSESVCACECMRARVCLCTRPLYSLGHLMGLLDFSVMLVGFLLLLISDYCTQLLHIKMCVFLCVTCCEWNWNEYFHSVNKSHKGTFYLRVKGRSGRGGGTGRKG